MQDEPSGLIGQSLCRVPGCPRPVRARGWCFAHWQKWRKYGDPLVGKTRLVVYRSAEEAFWARVCVASPDECWLWTGSISDGGYGRLTFGGRQRYAHQWCYELNIGPIPDGLVIDHLCHNADRDCIEERRCPHRRCCNPAHLEATTMAENLRRGNGLIGQNNRKTHCKYGHEFTPENTAYNKGWRQCRRCAAIRQGQIRMRRRMSALRSS